jgi:non-heme chloroperoxidase
VSTLTDPVDPELVREFQSSTLAQPVPPELFDMAVSESLKVPAAVWRATFAAFLDTADFSRELGTIQTPTLLLWGERDSYASRADQDVLRTTIDGARLTVYPDTGHALHWEEPERFARDLIAFVYERR